MLILGWVRMTPQLSRTNKITYYMVATATEEEEEVFSSRRRRRRRTTAGLKLDTWGEMKLKTAAT
jgi:hypothetical protein